MSLPGLLIAFLALTLTLVVGLVLFLRQRLTGRGSSLPSKEEN
jgi:hypothetical protein